MAVVPSLSTMPTAPPTDLRPMKATTSASVPQGDEWAHEVKWDGMRVLARLHGGTVGLTSTNGLDATRRFPELEGLAAACGCDAVLDGEVVALDDNGRPDFGLLQPRMHLADAAEARRRAAGRPISLALFDVLWLDGHDTTAMPWHQRRQLLEGLVDPAPTWRVPAVHDDGDALFEIATAQRLEGIVSKQRDSLYLPGKRTTQWRKVKVRCRQEFVVGGWWPGEGNRAGGMGSLLVGVHDPGAPGRPLRFAGKVGTGFNARALREYEELLAPLEVDAPPFDPPPPAVVARHAHWVRPELVVEVEFAEWTSEGILRHPSHLGRRVDKDPADVVRELV
jgi:bifunctional non-homologous end joining protein LigD